MKSKHLLFIFRSPPYENSTAKEGLDAVLAASVFDQKISVLFLNDGVFQLKKGQHPHNLKNQEKMLSSLPIYDINNLFAHDKALHDRDIQIDECCLDISPINGTSVTELLHSADHILSF